MQTKMVGPPGPGHLQSSLRILLLLCAYIHPVRWVGWGGVASLILKERPELSGKLSGPSWERLREEVGSSPRCLYCSDKVKN